MCANAVQKTVACAPRSKRVNEYLITKKAKALLLGEYPPLTT